MWIIVIIIVIVLIITIPIVIIKTKKANSEQTSTTEKTTIETTEKMEITTEATTTSASITTLPTTSLTTSLPPCKDGIKNQDEADVDCGGSTCTKRCSLEQGCLSNTDCTTDNCDTSAKKCRGAWVKIASDSAMVAYCIGLGYESLATLSACESYCLSISGCNAVDWHAGGSGCTPRQCSYYPPKYTSHSGWEVWAITTETLTTTDLVWVKVASEGLMGDANCAEVGSDESVTWSLCESACLALSSCNAIDFSYGGTQCTYRHCTTYPPNYQSASGWEVWAITTGTSTSTNTTIHVAE
ncbi:unnamed protein product [Adineta steineri]|uniref:Uncharacterized protein n=1 Tax=Adineta steineri TaxID=433720 RepID=A0A814N4Y6_9BILA|nr:unnamed protein product [Adineta steineri]